MKINFGANILDLERKPLIMEEKPATLGLVSCMALLGVYPDERELSADQKIKRFRLAEAASKGGEQDVRVDDVALLKKLIAKGFGALVVGRAFDIIEPPLEVENAKQIPSASPLNGGRGPQPSILEEGGGAGEGGS